MNVVFLAAGAGHMHCGACRRDIGLVRAMIARGHDAQLTPLYTPLRGDGQLPIATRRIFLGGVNAYLQQRFAVFRRLPKLFDRFLDSPLLLRLASRFAVSTAPSRLGPMTVSVLSGRDGRQRKEFDHFLGYLRSQPAPHAFVITNTLLSAFAPELKKHFNAPVICGVQGEDDFIRAMSARHRDRARRLIRRNADAIDLFISPYEGYRGTICDFLGVDEARIRVIRSGPSPEHFQRYSEHPRDPFVIGYLSVVTPKKGLDILVDAWRLVSERAEQPVTLRVAGQILDRRYWRQIQRTASSIAGTADFEYVGEVDLQGKLEFLRNCSVFSVPSRIPEARGLAAMEAIASGVPVVLPKSGIFSELISATRAGLLFDAEDVPALAECIAHLIDHPNEADRMGREGAAALEDTYGTEQGAAKLLSEIDKLVTG